MKTHKLVAIGLAMLSTITILGVNTVASAKAVKVPASLRGTWYHYDPTYDSYEKFHATKYHLKISGTYGTSSYSGVKYPKYANGHAQMSITKTPKGYYKISAYATDDEGLFKRVSHKGHAALKQPWHEIPDTGTYVDYWYKTKKIARHPSVKYKIAKTNAFYFNKYTPAYLQADYKPQKLYTSASDATNKSGSHITVKSIYKKYSARWDNGNKNDVLRIRINSKTYYTKANGAFQAYNSWKDGKVINSPYSPHSSSKIVIRHGDKYSTAKYWDKVTYYKGGTLTGDSYTLKNSSWHKD